MSRTATWTDWSCTVAVTVEHDRRIDAAERIVRSLMADVDRAVSRFRADSELARVSRAAGVLVPVSRLTFDLVGVGLRAAQDTDGLVDPTLGSALAEAGYDEDITLVRGRRSGHLPEHPRSADWRSVRTDATLRRVGVPGGVELDLGATAKPWAADEAARRIHRRLGTPALVEIGGDLAAVGRPHAAWRIDVAELRGEAPERVDLAHGGLATSSVRARRWTTRDGQSAHHVLDPETGRPTTGPWRTVSVWAPTALRANVASTAALVLGEQAVPWLTRRGLDARLVRDDGSVARVGHWPAVEAVAA